MEQWGRWGLRPSPMALAVQQAEAQWQEFACCPEDTPVHCAMAALESRRAVRWAVPDLRGGAVVAARGGVFQCGLAHWEGLGIFK